MCVRMSVLNVVVGLGEYKRPGENTGREAWFLLLCPLTSQKDPPLSPYNP